MTVSRGALAVLLLLAAAGVEASRAGEGHRQHAHRRAPAAAGLRAPATVAVVDTRGMSKLETAKTQGEQAEADATEGSTDAVEDEESNDASSTEGSGEDAAQEEAASSGKEGAAMGPKERERKAYEAELHANVKKALASFNLNLKRQVQLKSKIADLDDVAGSTAEIDHKAAKVATETQSEALGEFLSDMWKDLREMNMPFYRGHLVTELEKEEASTPQLRAALRDAEAAQRTQKESWAAEKKKREAVKVVTLGDR